MKDLAPAAAGSSESRTTSQAVTAAAQADPPDEPRRLVIVEDDYHTRLALRRLLEREGHDAITFSTAAEATTWLAETVPPAVEAAIIDIHLPDGDGIDLTRQMRRRLGPEIPIVIVSGDTSMQTLSRLQDAGADRFVGKPLSLGALHEALRAAREE